MMIFFLVSFSGLKKSFPWRRCDISLIISTAGEERVWGPEGVFLLANQPLDDDDSHWLEWTNWTECVCVSAWLLSTVSSAAHHWMHLLAPPTLQRLLRRIHRVLLLKRLLHLPSWSLLQQSSAPCLTKQKVFSTTSPKLSWLIYLISSWLAVSAVLGVISSPEACNINLRVILSLFFYIFNLKTKIVPKPKKWFQF